MNPKHTFDFLNETDFQGINSEFFIHKLYEGILSLSSKCLFFQKELNKQNVSQISSQGKNIELKSDFKYELEQSIIAKNIISNIKVAQNWSKEINFRDASNPKQLNSIFVPIDFYLTPKRTHLDFKEEPKIALSKVDLFSKNTIILGGPGAGKTTLMKKLFSDINVNKKTNFLFPIVIQFRYEEDISEKSTIFDILLNIFGINLQILSECENIINRYESLTYADEFDDEIDSDNNQYNNIDDDSELNYSSKKNDNENEDLAEEYKIAKEAFEKIASEFNRFRENLLIDFIDNLEILIIFDGFDELPNNLIKNRLLKSIETLSLSLNKTKFILTSRTGEFELSIPNSQTYEIADFSEIQISTFIKNWFRKTETSSKMLQEINNSPYKDTTLKPLNLAHLCALYEKYGEIPNKPKTVYKKIVQLLIEDWDSQRNIRRVSKYSQFTVDRKFEFLCHLSYILTSQYGRAIFTKELIETCYKKISENYELPINEISFVINELESFTGLFIKSGFDKFEFAHKSIQEYLSAEYIVKSQFLLLRNHILIEMPNELAIATSLSSNPSLLFATIIFDLIQFKNKNFDILYIRRIIVEKPDFGGSTFLAITFCYLYDTLVKEELDIKKAKFHFHMLLSIANENILKKSFQELKQVFWKKEKIENSTEFKVTKVGDSKIGIDLELMKVPPPYNNYITLDKELLKLYNS